MCICGLCLKFLLFSYFEKSICSSCRELAGFKRSNKSCWFWSCSRDKLSTAIYRICLDSLVCGGLPTFCLPFRYARSWIRTPVMRGYLKLNYGLHRYRAPEVLLQSPMYHSAIGESVEKKVCLETSKWLWLNFVVGFLPSFHQICGRWVQSWLNCLLSVPFFLAQSAYLMFLQSLLIHWYLSFNTTVSGVMGSL